MRYADHVLLALGLGQAATAAVLGAREPLSTATVSTATASTAEPTAAYNWQLGYVAEFPIHESCNRTERAQLRRGLNEAVTLAAHARDHILQQGNSSAFYTKYFGSAPTGEVLGWFEKVVSGNRAGITFRCDDIDGNCGNDGWAGHWRGENATDETVICPLSYEIRKPLEALCGFGYTVAGSSSSYYFGSDLIHRFFHLPKIGEETVGHYADSYAECLALAQTTPEEAVRNTHSLQYFALDVYAYDIAVPGEGCTGQPDEADEAASASASASTAAATATPTATTDSAPSTTDTAGKECHTHANGDVHCS